MSRNNPVPWTIVIGYALFKGATVAGLTVFIGTTFGQSLLVAFVSGSLGMIGMIGAAWITMRNGERNREMLHDIKQKVEANNREGDKIDAESTRH